MQSINKYKGHKKLNLGYSSQSALSLWKVQWLIVRKSFLNILIHKLIECLAYKKTKDRPNTKLYVNKAQCKQKIGWYIDFDIAGDISDKIWYNGWYIG